LPFSFSETPRQREPIAQLAENDGAYVGAQDVTAASDNLLGREFDTRKEIARGLRESAA
jgi:hypothetical protein